MENPLSRIPNRSDLPKGPSLRQLASQYIPEPVKETGRLAEMIGKSAADFAFGEDSGLPLAESLIPGAELVSKVSQGKRPGALDVTDVVPGVGSLKTIGAMGPIVGTLKELKGGGRLGKIARNLEKAKNPVFKMYHRTDVGRVPSIMREGLLVSPPDKGIHTFSEDAPNMVWLSRTPEAPVLTDKANRYPRSVGHIEVTMPKIEYKNRKQIIDNRWGELPNDNRDFVPIPKGGKFGSVTIFPEDIGPSHLRDISDDYWKKQEYAYKLSRIAHDAGVDTHGTLGELEDRLRSQNIKTRHDAVKSGKFKGWKPGELPVLKRNRYLGTAYTNYSPAEQKRRAAVYDKFYGTDKETHPEIMRRIYYDASPEGKRNVMKYLKQDYERDWISDEDWFDYDTDMREDYLRFLQDLESGKELKNYFPLTGFED